MLGEFHDLDEIPVWGIPRKPHAVAGKYPFVFPVELVPVAVTLGNLPLPVGPVSQRTLLDNTREGAETPGPMNSESADYQRGQPQARI